MILLVMFYAALKTFVLKCKFNLKSLAPPLKVSGCATVCIHLFLYGNVILNGIISYFDLSAHGYMFGLFLTVMYLENKTMERIIKSVMCLN